MIQTNWKILPCPMHAGKHVYHDNRWIASVDAEVEMSPDGRSWALTTGHLVCEMRDIHPSNTHLISAAPELLAACERMAEWFKQNQVPELQGIACQMFQAIDKARGI